MGIIRTIRMPAHRMVTGARDGLLAACSSAPDRGTTFITAIPVIGRSTEVAGITAMATTPTMGLDGIALKATATTDVPTATGE